MPAIITVLVALLSFLTVMLLIFRMTFVRKKDRGINDLDAPINRNLKEYRHIIGQGMNYIEKTPFREVNTESFDGLRLFARYYSTDSSKSTILLFHGYRSSGKRDFSCAVEMYRNMGLNVLLVDQRSHGKSDGKIIAFGIKERYDVLTWVDFIENNYPDTENMILGGMSMGATTVLMASALELSSKVKGIVADCGFTSPVAIIRRVSINKYKIKGIITVPVMNLLCKLFGKFSIYDASTETALKKCRVPVLFIHGRQDRLVPFEMSQKGFEAFTGEKEIVIVDGADHGFSFLVNKNRVKGTLEKFIMKCCRN